MTIKIWDVTAGKITSLVFDNGKNRKILILKNPVEVNDKKFIDEIDNAVRVISRHVVEIINEKLENGDIKNINDSGISKQVSSVQEMNSLRDFMLHYNTDTNNKGSHKKVVVDKEISKDKKLEQSKDLLLQHNTGVNDVDNGTHEEANDKMDLLFQKGDDSSGKKVRYLIDLNSEKDGGNRKDNVDKKDGGIANNDPRNIVLIPEEDVIKTRNTMASKAYHDYEVAFQHEIPELLDLIKNNSEIMVKISDIAKELGESFEKKSDVSIYTGIRHILFKHGVKVSQCTFKEIDPVTNKGRRGLKMRMLQKGDRIPSSFRGKEYRK